jgi:hypothetical protein
MNRDADPRRLFEAPPELEPERASGFRADVEAARREADPERDAFLASPVGKRIGEDLRVLQERLVAKRRVARRRRAVWGALTLALAAGIAVVVVAPWSGDDAATQPDGRVHRLGMSDDIRLKGSTSLLVARRRGNTAEPLSDGARLAPRDRIRFICTTRRAYAMIVNVEARGAVQSFYPYPAGSSVALGPARPDGTRHEVLGGSIELDESLGTERFVGVFSDAPLSFAQVAAAIERAYPRDGGPRGPRDLAKAQPLDLDADVVQLHVVKEPR